MLSEHRTLSSHFIKARSGEKRYTRIILRRPLILVEHTHVAVAEIIAKQENDVRFLSGLNGACKEKAGCDEFLEQLSKI